MRMSSRVSMRDVAQLAGVSQRTVSNVVNDFVHVAPDTRQRVQRAIDQLRYRPHLAARRLRGGRTGIVALALPELRSPYFAELAYRVQRTAQNSGVTLLIDQTGGSPDSERLVLDGYHSGLVDGLILNPISLSADDIARRELDVPVVLLGESIDTSAFLHVSIDNDAAAKAAVRHLLDLGRRRIAALGAPNPLTRYGPAARRHRGYQDAMGSAGVPVGPDLAIETDKWSRSSGYALAPRIAGLRPRADAVFCFDDALALGLMRGLFELGVRVPDDIAIMGWDDIEQCRFSTPTLSSVSPDMVAIAELAVRGLLEPTAGHLGNNPPVDFRIVPRESTGFEAGAPLRESAAP